MFRLPYRALLSALLCLLFLPMSPAHAAKTILVFGDSLSAGYGIRQDAAWPALLARRLQERKLDYSVVNASISGETTSGGRARIDALLGRHAPAVVIVALARAFAPNPRLVLADEPTGNLDAETGHQIIELMFAINAERGTTLILVTHDEEIAARCARRLRMHAGRIEEIA